MIPDPTNPQAFNRYSYVLNNPLKYVDPSGHFTEADMEEEERIREAERQRDQENHDNEPNLPIDDDEEETYTIVWGTRSSVGIGLLSYKEVVVVENQRGKYFQINTKGWGGDLGASVSLIILTPEESFEFKETWSVDPKFTLFGLFDFEASGGVKANISLEPDPNPYTTNNNNVHLSLSTPSISVTVTKTTVIEISKQDIYKDVPRWARRRIK